MAPTTRKQQLAFLKTNLGAKFVVNTDASLQAEFARIANARGWGQGSKRWRKAWNRCFGEPYTGIGLVVATFDADYGSDPTDVAAWQKLCYDVGIQTAPPSVTKCKKALKGVFVNIWDFVESHHRPVRRFASYGEFRSDIRSRPFPKAEAKADTFLGVFLRVVFGFGSHR